MKKSILLIMAIILSSLVYSQNINKYSISMKSIYQSTTDRNYIDKENKSQFVASKPVRKTVKSSKSLDDLKKHYISSSANIYTTAVTTSTCLTSNQKINTIMFTYRGNPAGGFGKTSGNILSSISEDGGVNWKAINITGSDAKLNRYPSGVIFTPKAGSLETKSYAVIAGPTTDNTSWVENYFGSASLDSTNFNTQYVSATTSQENFPRIGMASCDDGKIHTLGYSYFDDLLDSLIWKSGVVNNASFDSVNHKFIWSSSNIKESFYQDSKYLYFTTFNMVWSQDGSVGYVYFIGIDSTNNYESYMPIVYKSTDAGKTWEHLADYDFSTLTDITANIWRSNLKDTVQSNYHKTTPFFNSENDAVVDSFGNLHIFGLVAGRFNENIDSIGYVYKYEPQKLFDVFTTSSGWGAELIDTIRSSYVAAATSGFGSGTTATGWNHRIQTSRTSDGKKLFVVWSDTDTAQTKLKENFFPNIIAYGKDVSTGFRTISKNFTANTIYEGDNFWQFVGDVTLTDADKYRIPITTTATTSKSDPEDSVAHYFLAGIYFKESDFVVNPAVNNISKKNMFSVSQNYPNPFKGSTSIIVNLEKPSTLGLDVRNLLGQKVYEIPVHKESIGEHILNIKSNSLDPGIYIYTVKSGFGNISRKMIIN